MSKNKGGRPTKFDSSFIEQAYNYCCLGADDKKLAEFFGVCKATINGWKHEHPKFLDSIKSGKDKFDLDKVEGALIHRALGYSHKEVKTATHEGKITDVQEFDKHYPPDTTALIFWLKNRNPERWRDKHDVDVKTTIDSEQQRRDIHEAIKAKHKGSE